MVDTLTDNQVFGEMALEREIAYNFKKSKRSAIVVAKTDCQVRRSDISCVGFGAVEAGL